MKLGAVLAVLALSATGCPIAIPSDPINVTVHGRKIAVETGDVDFVVPGETTQGEVIARLGAPYTVLTTPPVLVYTWRVLERHLGWGLVMYRAGIPLGTTPVYRDDTLLVALDEAGKVRRAEIVVRNTAEHTEREQAYHWAQRRGLCGERPTPRFTPQPSPPDRGTLYVYRPHALWQSYAAVNVSLADVVVA